MKRVLLIEMMGLALLSTAAFGLTRDTAPEPPVDSGEITFSETFLPGVPSPAQCNRWRQFQTALTPNRFYTKVTMKGTFDRVGVSCTNASIVERLADALHTNGAVGPLACDGRNWRVGACGGGTELNATGTICTCQTNEYSVRPCRGTKDWGGVKTNTCTGPFQVMTVVFEFSEEPLGACCMKDGSCRGSQSEVDCARAGGVKWHEGKKCSQVSCKQKCVYETKKIKQRKCNVSGCRFQRVDCTHVTQASCQDVKDCRRRVRETSTCTNPNEKGKCKHILQRCGCDA